VAHRLPPLTPAALGLGIGTFMDMSNNFFDPTLLETEYAEQLRTTYEDAKGTPFLNYYRSYPRFISALSAIHEYKKEHARSYAKRVKQEHDLKNCEAIFSKIIAYSCCLPLVQEGHIRALYLKHDDYDLKIERRDGSAAFLEVFCIMPDFIPDDPGVIDIQTHTQQAMSSVRQKLLRKIAKQRQMKQNRENWAVIELNNHTIAGDFAVLSSLSSGYKIELDRRTMKRVREGYDWSGSVFEDESTSYLRGIIYFSLGNYADRRLVLNPLYGLAK
jgi:hypothetical protein